MIEITVHYLDNGLVSYTGQDLRFSTVMKSFILDQKDGGQIIIPLTSVRHIKTSKPYSIIGAMI